MKIVENGALSRLVERLTTGRSATRASLNVAERMVDRRAQFEAQRKKIDESIERGARLTKHRFTI